MSQNNSIKTKEAKVESSEINSEGDIEIIGGDKIRIGDSVMNLNFSLPKIDDLDELSDILDSNRDDIDEGLEQIFSLANQGYGIYDDEVQSNIIDIASSAEIVKHLIRQIRSRGGKAKTHSREVSIIKEILKAITKGKNFAAEEKERLELEEKERKKQQIKDGIITALMVIGGGILLLFILYILFHVLASKLFWMIAGGITLIIGLLFKNEIIEFIKEEVNKRINQ